MYIINFNKGNTVGKISSHLSETEKAYIAGFLDGDGSIIGSIERHKEKKYGYRVRVIMKFSQHTDNIYLLKFLKEKIDEGNILKGDKVSELVIKSQTAIKNLLVDLQPYSILKQSQIKNALSLLNLKTSNRKSLIRSAKLANQISKHNLKSKSRKKLTLRMFLQDISHND